MIYIFLDEHPTTETVPVNPNVQTNSSLNTDNEQNKNENSTNAENDDVTKSEPTTKSNESSQSPCVNDGTSEPQVYEDSIRIRLKYLNDNCRLVEGRLQENIGIFKRYNFQLYFKINSKILKIMCY